MKTMILLLPLGEVLDLGPYDILDIFKGTEYEDEAHFRGQSWVKDLGNIELRELPDFIADVNDDAIDTNNFWLGFVYFKDPEWVDPTVAVVSVN